MSVEVEGRGIVGGSYVILNLLSVPLILVCNAVKPAVVRFIMASHFPHKACHPALHSSHLVEYESVSAHREDCRDVNFKSPPDCDPPDCDFTLAWVDSGQWVNFSLVAIAPSNVSAWAAVGFSGDTLMVCVCEGGWEREIVIPKL